MTTESFTIAQQAANTAYDMTLDATHDEAQAADDYRAVMNAYHKCGVVAQHADGTQEVHPGWFMAQAVTNERARQLADEQRAQFLDWLHGERGAGCAGNSADEYDSGSEGRW